jgi:signal transduction histidine kinase/ligand-binding sensor domain-containing protein
LGGRLGAHCRRAGLVLAALVWLGAGRVAVASLLDEYTVRRWTLEDGLPAEAITSLAQTEDGFLWCTTARQRVRFDGVRFVVAPRQEADRPAPSAVSAQDTPPGCEPRQVTLLTRGPGPRVWVLANGELFSKDQATWQRLTLPAGVREGTEQLTALLADEAGALWAGGVHGVYRLQQAQWSELTDRDGVFPWDVRCLAIDCDQNIWIGTSGGLLRLRRKVLQAFRTGQSTGAEIITALLAETPTNIWVGLAGSGLLGGPPANLCPVRLGALSQRITISSLLRGRAGALWIGTQGDGLWRWRNGLAERILPAPENQRPADGISALLEDRRGVLWVGTWQGLQQVNAAGRLVTAPARGAGGAARSLPEEMVQALYEDAAGGIWVGYQSAGVLHLAPDGGARWYDRKTGLPSNSIRALFQDAEGVFWIGTTGGLVRWQGASQQAFTRANGLVDDSILQILEDDFGYLWLGTRRGIMRVKKAEFAQVTAGHKKMLAARAFGVDEGMFDPECTGRLGARAGRTADGHLWFPTVKGLVMAAPQTLPRQTCPVVAYVEEIRVAQQVVYTAALAVARAPQAPPPSLELPRGQREVAFLFTAPLLTVPERAYFKFQLTGHDVGWSQAATERVAQYARLTPGTYTFRVMVRDRDGDWSQPAALSIVVPSFFWETTWWWLLVLTGVVAGTVGVVHALDKRQTARQLRELEQRNAVERERGRIARDIHDDVGAGLTEMAMLSELAQAEGRPPGEQRAHLDNIFRRARQLVHSLDEIVWAINPANDTLESLISYIGEFAQDFLGVAGLVCRLDLPVNPPALVLGSALRHHVCLAVKESLHNIVKHADASEVHVVAQLAGQELMIRIQDNGRGFADVEVGGVASGHDGLTNLQARLDEIGGCLLRESRPGAGTCLVLSVKLPTTAGAAGKP